MSAIPASRLRRDGEVLWEEGDRVLLRLRREHAGGAPTVLAVRPPSDHPSPSSLARLNHELGLAEAIDPAWGARPIEMVREHGRVMLLLADPGTEPLARRLGAPLPLGAFLRLAVALAEAVAGMHAAGLVHKDLKPGNILVNDAFDAVALTGFGIASRVPRERQPPLPPELMAGTLSHMAPEQTGRMNRSIDARSDLYAVGVTLYEALTGTLPFSAADPMEWIHCHIARQPPTPAERIEGLPAVVSAIVMKLLAKAAEDRYQTAAGLAADLRRCLRARRDAATVPPFALGTRDAPRELLFREALYGRAAEVRRLAAAFDAVATEGSSALVLVSGYSGIGKSSVVNELHRALVPRRGLFASGKFDQYKRGVPYATIAQALQGLVRALLSKNDEDLAAWRRAILDAVGQNGQLIANLIPELALVIGAQPPVPEISPRDAQMRFQRVFRRFLGVFARPEHPLTIFLDDLQWLDSATLDLVAHLAVHADVRHLLLVGAYRDNEVGPEHALGEALAAIRKAGKDVVAIKLDPLGADDIGALLADALRTAPDAVRPLAELVHARSGGNPFFAIQFVTELADAGLIALDPAAARWRWDVERIEGTAFTANVADLMTAKLARLPPRTQEALLEMARVGGAVEASTLALLGGVAESGVHADLWPAIRAGLILRHDGQYRFMHDRIREAAYERSPEPERAEAHLRIGRTLLAGTPPEALDGAIFEIVNQLNRGIDLVDSPEERRRVAELNLAAGKRAKAGTAYVAAIAYLATGRACLAEDAWRSDYALVFDLELNLAECEFLTGAFAPSAARLDRLSVRARDTVDLAPVTRLSLDLNMTLGLLDRAIEVGTAYLRRVDPDWPEEVTPAVAQEGYDRLVARMGLRPLEALLDLPVMTDPVQRAAMDVFVAFSSPALFAGQAMRQFVICRMVSMCLEHGNSDGAPLAYVLLASVQGMFLGDYAGGYRLARIGLELVERPGFGRFRARAYSVFAVHVVNWTQPLHVARGYLDRAFDAAQQSGDLSYAAFSCIDMITNLLASGMPLPEVERRAVKNRETAVRLGFELIRLGISEQLTIIRMLRGTIPPERSFTDAVLAVEGADSALVEPPEGAARDHHAGFPTSRHRSAKAIGALRELEAQTIMNRFPIGLAAVEEAPPLSSVPTQFERAGYQFYQALSHAALAGSSTGTDRERHLATFSADHRQVLVWAESCPVTFRNRAALLDAELARLEGRAVEAETLYEQAIEAARHHGFVQNEAIASERAAHFFEGRGLRTAADAYFRRARDCYRQWGADAKVLQIEQARPGLRESTSPFSAAGTVDTPVDQLDLATILRLSRTLSEAIELSKAVDTLMTVVLEHAGANRAILLLAHGRDLLIEAEAATARDGVAVHRERRAPAARDLPGGVLRYVRRTRESVLISDTVQLGDFRADDYLRATTARSVLCLPLLKPGKLVGVLYLENAEATHGFTPARIGVLQFLASQAAISLENARLYADLEEREARIRRLVDSDIIGVFMWTFDGRIPEANDAFLAMLGFERADLAAGTLRWPELVPNDDEAGDARRLAALRREGTLPPVARHMRHADGTIVPVLVGAALFQPGGEEGVAFVLDLTERRRAEAAARDSELRYRKLQADLAHANRVATMGHLSAWIAHDVRQPLVGVVTSGNAGLHWLAADPPNLDAARRALERIVRDGHRAADVLDRTRALFKKTPPRKELVDVNAVIAETVALAEAEAELKGIDLRIALARPLPVVAADRIHLQQVILNLVANAIEAIGRHGAEPREIRVRSFATEAGEVAVSIRDTGPGLAIDFEEPFEAFHTTKPGGMGIGLAICRSIVESYGGQIRAAPNQPRGAVFEFTLPPAAGRPDMDRSEVVPG